jgi:hypothetical protein
VDPVDDEKALLNNLTLTCRAEASIYLIEEVHSTAKYTVGQKIRPGSFFKFSFLEKMGWPCFHVLKNNYEEHK